MQKRPCESKKILMIGGTGFLGNEIGIELVKLGYEINLVGRTLRSQAMAAFPATSYKWSDDGTIPAEAMNGVDTIINLAGESIGNGYWTIAKKSAIKNSRVKSTEAAVKAANTHKIRLLVQASAIGYYGECNDVSTETTDAGTGFLAETAQVWEGPLRQLDQSIRSVTIRLGVILGTSGGAFLAMLNPYAMGIGAKIGSGKQILSWIHQQDVVNFTIKALEDTKIFGIYNLTAPNPISYKQLHEAMIAAFGGISWLTVPSLVFKLVLGEKSQLLLVSQNIIPDRLIKEGFKFAYPDIKSALGNLLGDKNKDCHLMHVKQWLPYKLGVVWDFFSVESNLERITPSWLHFKTVAKSTKVIGSGTVIDYKLRIHGLPTRWRSEISKFDPPHSFVDIQLKGPYKTWQHTHRFTPLAEGTLIEDLVRFKLPFGLLGKVLGFPLVQKDVGAIFAFRRNKIMEVLKVIGLGVD